MKIQDILFFIVLAVLLFRHRQKEFVVMGLGSLVVAIPLFARHVFFTAERLTWYAAAFFLISVFFPLRPSK